MRRPRLLCLMHLPPPLHGVTVVNQRITESASIKDRFELEVVPLRFADSVEDLGRVSAKKLARAAAIGLALARGLARRPHALYLTLSPHGGALYRDLVYAALAKLAGVPRIIHVHAHGSVGSLGAVARWVFDGAWVIHLAPQLAGETAGLVDASRVLIVENGVPDRNPSGALASSGARVPRVLFLSNMLPGKGPTVLLDALALVRQRGIALDATLAGPGAPAELLAACARLGVRHVGAVDERAKDTLYRTHDVFALPTLRDALPLVIIEAMQYGLPVVSTTVGGIPELVVGGTTGFLVPPGDPVALAEGLAALATQPGMRRALGAEGRRRYAKRFTQDAFEQRLADALARAIDELAVGAPPLARDQPAREA